MNSSENDHLRMNFIKQSEKRYVSMDLDQISNIISQKINTMKPIDDEFINEICDSIKSYCEKHNKMINDWFDDNFMDDLKALKANNEKYMELSNSFSSSSFIIVPNF